MGRFVGKVRGWSGGGACPEEVRLELDLGVRAGVDQREASGWTAGDVLGDEGWPGLPSGKMRGRRKTEAEALRGPMLAQGPSRGRQLWVWNPRWLSPGHPTAHAEGPFRSLAISPPWVKADQPEGPQGSGRIRLNRGSPGAKPQTQKVHLRLIMGFFFSAPHCSGGGCDLSTDPQRGRVCWRSQAGAPSRGLARAPSQT